MSGFNSDLNKLFQNFQQQQLNTGDKSTLLKKEEDLKKKENLFDVNGDGKLNQNDINLFIKGNVDGNNEVTKEELNFISKYKDELTKVFKAQKADFELDGIKYINGEPAQGVIKNGNNLSTYKDGKLTKIESKEYDDNGKLTKIKTKEYNDSGKLSKIEIKGYDDSGKLSKKEIKEYNNEKLSKIKTYEYDNNGQVTKAEIRGYNSNGKLTKIKTNEYDNNGQVTKTEEKEYNNEKLSKIKTNEYNSNKQITKIEEKEYDDSGKLSKKEIKEYNNEKLSKIKTYEYDNNGQVTKAEIRGYNSNGKLNYYIVDKYMKDFPTFSGNLIKFSENQTCSLDVGDTVVIDNSGNVEITSADGKTVKKFDKLGNSR